jgi:predicted nucleic acid-binding Zn ribbon protein
MPGSLKPLSELLSSGFVRLAQQADEARDLTQRVRRCLGEPLGEHVLSAGRRGEELVIRVDSAAWSAQVRYAGQRLIEVLQEPAGDTPIQRVRVRVGRP